MLLLATLISGAHPSGRQNKSQFRVRPSRGRDMNSVAEQCPVNSSRDANAASRVMPFR